MGAYLVAIGLFLIGNAVAMRLDRIPRNGVIGLRTRTTTRNDRAWYTAQRAGASWVAVGGAVALGGGIVTAATEPDPPAHLWVLGPTVLVLLVGAWRGVRAARQASP